MYGLSVSVFSEIIWSGFYWFRIIITLAESSTRKKTRILPSAAYFTSQDTFSPHFTNFMEPNSRNRHVNLVGFCVFADVALWHSQSTMLFVTKFRPPSWILTIYIPRST